MNNKIAEYTNTPYQYIYIYILDASGSFIRFAVRFTIDVCAFNCVSSSSIRIQLHVSGYLSIIIRSSTVPCALTSYCATRRIFFSNGMYWARGAERISLAKKKWIEIILTSLDWLRCSIAEFLWSAHILSVISFLLANEMSKHCRRIWVSDVQVLACS